MKTERQDVRSATRDSGNAPPESLRVFAGASSIVTGGASGIGRALGGLLASRDSIACLADRQIDMAEQAAVEIRAGGGKATAAQLDVSDYSAVEHVLTLAVLWEFALLLLALGGATPTIPAFLKIPAEQYYFYQLTFYIPMFLVAWLLAGGIAYLLAYSIA
jgi:hypothetical protein